MKTGATTFICQAKAAADKAPCDDGQACTVGDSCLGGACTAGKGNRLFAGELLGADKYAEVYSIAPLKGGGAAMVGEVRETANHVAAKKRRWMVWVIGADGAQLWAKDLGAASKSLVQTARAVLPEADGSLLIGGTLINKTSSDVRLIKMAADGSKLTGQKTFGKTDVYEELRALVPHSGGGWVVIGTATTSKLGIQPLAMRVTLSGKTLAQTVLPIPAMVPAGATTRPGGVTAAAGTGFVNAKAWGWAFAVDSDLKPLWKTDLRDRMRIVNGIASTSNGYLVAGSVLTANANPHPVFLTLDASGKKGVRTELTTFAYPFAITAVGKDSFVAVGSRPGPTVAPFIAGVDGNANHTWTLQPLTAGELWAVTPHPDGKVIAAGRRRTATDQKIIVRAMTAWGQIKCAASGACAGKKADDCDDANGCTNDFCEAKTGCLHSNNAAACDDGSVCTTKDGCSGGKCVGSSPLKCDDGNACTADTCDPKASTKSACKHTLLNIGCDDGNICTTGDKCLTVGCKGTPRLCDDGDVCSVDTCDPAKGCVSTAAASKLCDDKNPCTKDTCDGKEKNLSAACKHTLTKFAACDDGDGCTTLDRCDHLGKCSLGQPKLWSVQLDSNVRQRHLLFGVDVAKSGHIVAAGLQTFIDAKQHGRGGWFVRMDATGKVLCQNYVNTTGYEYPHLWGVLAEGDGAVAAGYATAKGKSHPLRSWFVGFDAKCNVAWQRHGTVTGLAQYIARTADGFAATGSYLKSAQYRTHVVRIGGSGALRWQKDLPNLGHERPQSIVTWPDGGVVIGMSRQIGGGSPVLRVVWLDGGGNLLRERNYAGGFKAGAILLPDGDAMRMVSTRLTTVGSVGRFVPYIGRISAATGALLGEKHLIMPQIGSANVVATSALELANGDTLLVGNYSNLSSGGELIAIRPDGKLAWRTSTDVADVADYLTDSALTADGGIVAVGELFLKNTKRSVGTVIRVDPWGNQTCKDAGKCSQQSAASCDDGNGCTLDSCDVKAGCTNKETLGTACSDGNPCTADGSCKDGSCQAGSPRLFEASYQSPLSDRGVGVIPQSDGGYLAVSTVRAWEKPGATAPRGQLRKVDGAGKTLSTADLPNADVAHHGWSEHHVGNVERVPDGFWSVSRARRYKSSGSLQWNRHGEDGKVVKTGRMSAVGSVIADSAKICPMADGGAMVFAAWLKSARAGRVLPTKWGTFTVSELGDKDAVMGVGGCAQGTDGDVAGVGWNHSFDGKFGTVWIVRPTSTLPRYFSPVAINKRVRGAGTSINELHDVAAAQGGGWLAVGRTNAGHKYATDFSGWMVWFNKGAAVTRTVKIGKGQRDQFASIKPHPRGGWIMSGMSSALGSKTLGAQAWAVRTNDNGDVLWQRSFGGAGDDAFNDLSILADGSLVFAGTKRNGATLNDLFLVHTDPWGESSCPKSGACAAKTPRTCDDRDPCTVDTCSAAQGGCHHGFRPELCAEQPTCRIAPQKHRAFHNGKLGSYTGEELAAVVAESRAAVAVGFAANAVGTKSGKDGRISAFNDAGNLLWKRAAGADGSDEFVAITSTFDRYVAAGRTDSKALGAQGKNGWLQAFTKGGAAAWSRGYGGIQDDELADIEAGGGQLVSVGRTKTTSAGGWDGWLLVTDTNGKPLLDKRHGGKLDDGFRAVALGNDEFIGVGRSKGGGKGLYDGWLARMKASTGALIGAVYFGGSKNDIFNDVAVVRAPRKYNAKTGSVTPGVVTGFVMAGTRGDVGFGDGWLVATGGDGTLLWEKTYGGSAFADSFSAIASTPFGYAVSGRTLSIGAGKADPWLVAIDRRGVLRYQRGLGTPEEDFARDIAYADGGGFWLVGGGGAPTTRPLAWKTTNTGYATCKSSVVQKKQILEVCSALVDGQCEDGSECTVDYCDRAGTSGKKGCVHAVKQGKDKPSVCTPLNTKSTALPTCRHQLMAYPYSRSGVYYIDPGGGSTNDAFMVGCDMVTDGGGWTLVMALDKDTSTKWDITTHGGPRAQLAASLFGTIKAQHALDKASIIAIGKQGSTEYLADTGRGLHKTRPNDPKAFDWWRGVWDTNYFKGLVTTQVADGNQSLSAGAPHSPAAGINWLPTEQKPGVWTGKKCPNEGCVYVPGLSVFEATHNHSSKNNGAGGFNIGPLGRHQSRLFIR